MDRLIKTKVLVPMLIAVMFFQLLFLLSAETAAADNKLETLSIIGDGVVREVSFTRQDLENMTDYIVRHKYSTVNNFPTEKSFYREGVILEHILALAGLKDEASLITFVSSDGYTKTFTREELLNTPRYCFEDGKAAVEVPSIIALRDSPSGYNSLDFMEMGLTLGQRVKGEQNSPWFVKYLKTIEVKTEEPDQWEEVSFTRSPGPEGVTLAMSHPFIDAVKIYYTLDGSNPTYGSSVYNKSASYFQPHLNQPLLIDKTTEIRAIAIGPGKKDSKVSSVMISFSGPVFSDLADYPWARIAIEYLAEKKILSGMGDGRFAPGQNLTRAQFATMMVRAMGEEPILTKGKSRFTDIKNSDWHYGYVEKAAEKGWLHGYPDGSFQPNRALKREEMLTIVVSAIDSANLSPAEADVILGAFSDKSKISSWAKAAVARAEQLNIVEHGHIVTELEGRPYFDATALASRAEAAVTVYRMLSITK